MYAALGERAGEKLLQRGLELLLAAGFDAARDGDLNWLCACGHIKKEGDGGGEIVHVAAAGLVNITPGEEMHVRCLHIDVSLKLPHQIHIECSSDVAGSIVERGNLDESGHAIDGIVSRVPPKRTRASVNRNLWQGAHRKVRMDANDILRPDQAGIVEVTGFEEERVEGPEAPIIWIIVPTGSAGLETEPR